MEQECLLALQQDEPLHSLWQPVQAAAFLMLSGSGQRAVQQRQWHLPVVQHLGRLPMPLAQRAGRERQEAARQLQRTLRPLAQPSKSPAAAGLPGEARLQLCRPLQPLQHGHLLHKCGTVFHRCSNPEYRTVLAEMHQGRSRMVQSF